MQILQAKVNILDMAVLDQVEARLQVRGLREREARGESCSPQPAIVPPAPQRVAQGHGRARGGHQQRL